MTDAISAAAAGRFTFPATGVSVNRMGFGAMQLTGPNVFGDPADPAECRAVLEEAIALGVDHIDTSDFYGPYVVNRQIRDVLAPYPDGLTLVTKIGGRRDDQGAWLPVRGEAGLRRSVEENLERLGLEQMAIVNMRFFGPEEDVEPSMNTMRALQEEGLIGHIGVSTVDLDQLKAARDIAPIVCVQNHYNLVHRIDDEMIDLLADAGIAYVPYFPLGGFAPLQVAALDDVAASLGQSSQAVALAWLLHRSPNILVIPGTSKRAHLRANIAAGALKLGAPELAKLESIAALG